ncbi:hypothetical protein Ae201684P_020232 [Aphanomyces euteiches]|nr:hypothetical protein Ae201684P_020232 [Aphanomyces euteiches]
MSVYDLHDIPTQALGVVVARQKKEVMGRKIDDPRRIWIILSIFIELGVFSYVPVQLIMYDATSNYSVVMGWQYQVAKFLVFVMVILCDIFHTKGMKRALQKVILPLAYDTGFTTFTYAIIDIGACSNKMDELNFAGGSSCADPKVYWYFALIAVISFGILFWRTLLYKMHFSDQVFAVRFRFQTSYYSLMTFCRTACCLLFITTQKLILYVDDKLVYLVTGVANFIIFYLLFRYNYKNQPCLGVGKLLNNLRSLSFATSCYFSTYLVIISLVNIVAEKSKRNAIAESQWVWSWIVCGIYPFFGVTVWYINGRRAQTFEIPDMTLEQALAHPNGRIKAVAAVSLTLENQSEWTDEYRSKLVRLLYGNLYESVHSEQGMTLVYTCQAMWTLWFKYFTMAEVVLESTNCLPLGLWESAVKCKKTQKKHIEHSASSKVKGRLDSIKPTLGPPLTQLVEDTMSTQALASQRHLGQWSSENCPEVDLSLRRIVVVLADMARSVYPKARYTACKTLHEMYTSSSVRLTDSTMIYALCTLVASHEYHLATAAARTMIKLYSLHWKHIEWTKVDFTERLNMTNLSKFTVQYGGLDLLLLHGILHIILDCVKYIEMKNGREGPSKHYSDILVANLLATQAKVESRQTIELYFVIDDILFSIDAVCTKFIFRLNAVRVLRSNVSTIARSRRISPVGTSRHESRKAEGTHAQDHVKRYSWTALTKLATRARRVAFMTPAVAEIIQKRHKLRETLTQITKKLLDEGFQKKLVPTELTESTYHKLVVAHSILKRHPLVVDVVLDHFSQDETAYILDLLHGKLRHNPRRWS